MSPKALSLNFISAWSILGSFALALAFWWFFLWNRLPAVTDMMMYCYPTRCVTLRSLSDGFIPLWNPYIACGTTQIAEYTTAFFYPLFWIWNFTGLPNGLVGVCLLHAALAAGGCYLWLRCQKVASPWCALGSLSFAGSALMVYCWIYPNILAVATWIPWIFWSVHRILQGKGRFSWVPAGIFVTLQVLANYPIFTLYTLLAVLFWVVSLRPSTSTWKDLGWVLLFSFFLAACQWIPFLEYLTLAGRGGWWKEFPYFTRPVGYLTLFLPHVLGEPGNVHYKGSPANAAFNLYFGLVPLTVLILGCFEKWEKNSTRGFWSLSALGCLIWMAGGHFPILRVFPEKFLELAEPSKAAVVFIFCAVTFSALSLTQKFSKSSAKTYIFLFLLSFFWLVDILSVPFFLVHPVPNPFEQPEMRSRAQQLQQLVQSKRIVSLALPEELTYGGENSRTLSVQKPVENFLVNSNEAWSIRSAAFYLSLWPKNAENIMNYIYKGFPYGGDLLDIAGVRVFSLPQTLSSPKYKLVGRIGNRVFTLNTEASEDMRWAENEVIYPDRASILNALTRLESGWRQKVYLEKNKDGIFTHLPASQRILNYSPAASYERPCGSRVSLRTDLSKPGFMVFNENCWPGWRAWVDGKPVPILRAYGLFMAVAVPGQGIHQVDFRYEPASFRLGLFLTLIAVGFLVWTLFKNYSFSAKPA